MNSVSQSQQASVIEWDTTESNSYEASVDLPNVTVPTYFFAAAHPDDTSVVNIISPDMESGPWIAGGVVRRWFENLPANADIDVFCKSRFQADAVLFTLLAHERSSVVFKSENATTVSFSDTKGLPQWKVQVITRQFYKAADDVIADFDITVCQFLTDGTTMRVGTTSLADLKQRRIRFTRGVRPQDLPRVIKYIAYGFRPDLRDYRKIIESTEIKWGEPGQFQSDDYENL